MKNALNASAAFLLSILARADSADAQMQPQAVWAVTNGSGSASLNTMMLDQSGNVIVAGYNSGDYLTAKVAANGNLLWSARAQGQLNNLGPNYGITAVSVDAAGNVYVTGGLNGSRTYTTTFCGW